MACGATMFLGVLLVARAALACPAPGASDQQILNDNPHLRELFARYAEGMGAITPEGLQKLLDNLIVHAGRGAHEPHTGDDHVTHDHHPEDRRCGPRLGDDGDSHSGDDPKHAAVDGKDDRGRHGGHLGDDRSRAKGHAERSDTEQRDDGKAGAPPTTPPTPHNDSALRAKRHDHSDDHARDHQDRGRENGPGRGRGRYVGGGAAAAPRAPDENSFPRGSGIIEVASANATGSASSPMQRPVKCGEIAEILSKSGLSIGDSVTARGFLALCPGIVNYLDSCIMDGHEDGYEGHSHSHTHYSHNHGEFSVENWTGAIMSMFIIGLVGLACIMLIPALKRSQHYDRVNQFLMALAVGTLAGDALIHLLPHAISMEVSSGSNAHVLQAFHGFTALGGIILFLFLERFHNLFCGNGHAHGHSHELAGDLTKSKEEMDKETVGTATTTEDTGSQNIDKIGEKLSKHSKHNSFIYAESTMTLDTQNCFEGCNSSPSSDANGNTGNGLEKAKFGDGEPASVPEETEVICIEKSMEKEKLASIAAERERLVTSPAEKSEMGGELSLILNTPTSVRPKVLRQNSSSFNMVLQEYHVGHHGHSHHGHSHITGRKDSLRAMILVGDALHTFLDGMAIGAAFGTNITAGVATSIAVLCHELPHKVGDFALLFEMGMELRQAVKMMAMLWLFSFAGVVMGVLLGSIPTASPWIYSFTAGVFIYLALVDLLSELSVNHDDKFGVAGQMFLQGLGMLTGATIMLFIAIYEHDLEELLKSSF